MHVILLHRILGDSKALFIAVAERAKNSARHVPVAQRAQACAQRDVDRMRRAMIGARAVRRVPQMRRQPSSAGSSTSSAAALQHWKRKPQLLQAALPFADVIFE